MVSFSSPSGLSVCLLVSVEFSACVLQLSGRSVYRCFALQQRDESPSAGLSDSIPQAKRRLQMLETLHSLFVTALCCFATAEWDSFGVDALVFTAMNSPPPVRRRNRADSSEKVDFLAGARVEEQDSRQA